jgi:lipopolysaccharide/colanic/teichoic acid biosynthesis glycosyltransferase
MFDIQEIHAPRYARIKRLVDIVAGMAGLVLLIVAIPVVAIADAIGNRGPLFFTQERVGKGGRPFAIFKFRTMVGEPTGEWTDINDPRVSVVGRWMRRAHIDELPQSVNLIRGTISLVGPRPEQPRYVDELRDKIPFYDVRHLVNPGITGWAQVKFVYGSSVEDALQKLQYEFFYMRHQGPVLDLRILARTVRSVLRLHGR